MKTFAGFALTALVLSALAFMLGSYQTDVYRKLLLWVTLALTGRSRSRISRSTASVPMRW